MVIDLNFKFYFGVFFFFFEKNKIFDKKYLQIIKNFRKKDLTDDSSNKIFV